LGKDAYEDNCVRENESAGQVIKGGYGALRKKLPFEKSKKWENWIMSKS